MPKYTANKRLSLHRAMNGNETSNTGNCENSVFAGSSPAMRTHFKKGLNVQHLPFFIGRNTESMQTKSQSG
jgi:hypothetical protein